MSNRNLLYFTATDHYVYRWSRRALALEAGGASTAVLNAANEEVVEAFLGHRIPYPAIAEILDRVLDRFGGRTLASLAELEAVDAETRALTAEFITAR